MTCKLCLDKQGGVFGRGEIPNKSWSNDGQRIRHGKRARYVVWILTILGSIPNGACPMAE